MLEVMFEWFQQRGLDDTTSQVLARSVFGVVMIALSVVANYVAKQPMLAALNQLISRSQTSWDDAVLERKVLDRLAHLAPAVVIYLLTPYALAGYDIWIAIVERAVIVYLVLIGILVVDALLSSVVDIYRTFEVSRELPITGLVQAVKLVVYFIGGIIFISVLVDKSPLYFLSGLGALTAVILLVFKDTILGFVAGIQLSANKMVARGDWVEMPKYGAEGDVLDVGLTTVKVQNWDKTVTTIPTYALISESFKNWRGMQESGGRRIKRSIFIDIRSIAFCTEEMLARFSTIQYISAYIEEKKAEVARFNTEAKVDDSSLANGRRMTNVGTFRAYVEAYLENHPMINRDMTFLIRQLAPTDRGLPLEIYVFCKDKVWANYEAIQADIFDHILAVVNEFDLNVFQQPTGADFEGLRN